MDPREETNKRRKEGWIEAIFMIEALAVDKSALEEALTKHIDKLSKAKDVFVYEKKIHEIATIENPSPQIKEGFSQVAEVRLFVKSIYSMINIVILFGPSSIEILGPREKEMKIDELQSTLNLIGGLIHEFAAAGVGGLVITPK